MSRFDYLYSNFSSGEVSPLIEGRVDVDKYKSGVKTLENFYTTPHGPVIRRGGTKYVAEVKDSTKVTRLIPFSVSANISYVLEFGDNYIRFYTEQGQLMESDWTKLANPGTLPTSTGTGVAFNPEGSLLAVAHDISPYITIYNTSDWSKVTDPTILPTGPARGVTFNHDGSLMVVAHSVSPYITIYNTSDWSKVTDPGTLPTGIANGVAFNHDGSYLAIAHNTSPYVTIYDTSNWTKVTDPAILPTGTGSGVSFNNDGSLLAVAHSISPYITIYNTSDSTKVANPAILPTGTGIEVSFSPDNSLMAVSHYTSPYITIYNTSDWSKVTDPGTLPTGNAEGVAFSGDGSLLSVVHHTTPFITTYNISDWSKVTDPGTLPAGIGYGVAYDNFNLTAVAHAITPFVTIYTESIPYEIATTYSEDELFNIKFTQSADVLFLAHPDHAPATLSRVSLYNWTLANITFVATPTEWIANNYPTVVALFEQRLIWAATPDEPQTIWASVSASYYDLTIGTGDSDAFKYTIASDKVNTILWIATKDVLIIGTSGAEFKMASTSLGEPITPTNVSIRRQTNYGSKDILSLLIGDTVLFVQRGGKKIRGFSYKFEIDSYQAEDLTILSEHITGGLNISIEELTYVNEPNSVVWAKRTDGILVGLMYEPDQKLIGWFRYKIAGTAAKVKSIAAINNAATPAHDDIWLIVQRTINGSTVQYVEFIKPSLRVEESLNQAFYVDSGLSYTESLATNTFSNLGHLEGETVQILADGATHKDIVVSGGSVTLDRDASVVHIGLGYDSILRTLRLEGGNPIGSSQGQIQRISTVIIRLFRSLGLLVGDEEFDRIYMGPGVMDESVGLVSKDVELPFRGGYTPKSEIELKQNQPLPTTIIAIMAEARTR